MADTTKVITGKVRFSYVHVFEPEAATEGGKKKYSVSIIIPKSDKKTIKKIEKAIEAAKQAGKSKLANKAGKIPANLKTPLRDGDEDRPDDEAYENSYFINATSNRRPGVVDRALNSIMDAEDFYSGCYGLASINFFAYNTDASKGIAAGLNNLQKTADGEMLGGAASKPEDDFTALDDDDEDDEDDFEDDDDMLD